MTVVARIEGPIGKLLGSAHEILALKASLSSIGSDQSVRRLPRAITAHIQEELF